MKNRLYLFILLVMVSFSLPAKAVKQYTCDFESPEDRARWTLNPVDENMTLPNKWYFGNLGNNDRDGQYGLYISNDGGESARYTNKGCWVFAYDTVSLDHLTADSAYYTITFDYVAMGNVASNFDGLYLLWIPMTDNNGDSIDIQSAILQHEEKPAKYDDYVRLLQPTSGSTYLNGTSTWRQCAHRLPGKSCDGKPHYLAFVWANGSKIMQQPGAKLDNISITNNIVCQAPDSLYVSTSGTTANVSWVGEAQSYELSVYSYETQTWLGPMIVEGTQTTVSGVPVGQADFIVRSVCEDNIYSLKTILSKLIYYPDQLCVDYLNLDNAICYVNSEPPASTLDFDAFRIVRPVDNGPSNRFSRHVVHFDREETDPRTGGMAKTIPDGELASVRLGNWEVGNEAERIDFSFEVDAIEHPILLLKYIPILEAPDHERNHNPRFKLELFHNGKSIGECGMANFSADDVLNKEKTALSDSAKAQGWHLTPADVAFPGQQNRADVVWKEWTTVGIDLSAYDGETIKARLTTHDCQETGHSGYAYFTLGCSDANFKGMMCGALNPEFEAPEGFSYRWMYASSEQYRDDADGGSVPEQYVLGRDRHFEAGKMDDSVYVVDCMFSMDTTCYFSLRTTTLATAPIPVMNEPKIQPDCRENKYVVSFDASPSWVREIDHVKNDTIPSRLYHIEHYEWFVEGIAGGWSDRVTPSFTFPPTGGDYKVSLRVSGGNCDSTLYYNLHLDTLGLVRDTTVITLCDDVRKNGYVWGEKSDTIYHSYGLDSVNIHNEINGCDSVRYLVLREPHRVLVDTFVVPESLPFNYRGRTYNANAVDTIPISDSNCDTTWVLNFEVYESLQASMQDSIFVCAGEPFASLGYEVTRGRSLRYSYAFTDALLTSIDPISDEQKQGHYEVNIPLSATLTPNIYSGTLLLEDLKPSCNVTLPFKLIVQYASSVITQRWNDVLAIRNSDYNGGFEFDSVQWYLGNTPILGATGFNYYAGDGIHLNFGESYSALLTRRDGVKLFTCPFIPQPVAADINDLPTLVSPSAPMHIPGKGTAYWYDILGRQYHAQPYNDSDIASPAAKGYYLLVLQTPDERSIHPIMVR